MKLLGIRREDKNIWEKRVPLIPEDVKELKERYGIETVIQPDDNRAYSDNEFLDAGASVDPDISKCSHIIAVKEIPVNLINPGKVYLFFSHTIKGQDYNMPLLQRIIDSKSTLIDYECIADDSGRRLVFFGRFAGLAGMIDTLNGLGRRLKSQGFNTPFIQIKPAFEYADIHDAKEQIKEAVSDIEKENFPEDILPLVFGFAGYGNVSKGAQEIFDLIPHQQITPAELLNSELDKTKIYKVIFEEKDLVEPKESGSEFELQDYYNYPEKYKSKFQNYLSKLDVLVNGIFWNENYPRLLTKEYLKENFDNVKLEIVTDISCDINGSVEFTEKVTEPDNPAFVYDPASNKIEDGFEGKGIVNIAVDNFPAELPRDSSRSFSESLRPFINKIMAADYELNFNDVNLPSEIKRAVIVYKGELAPDYKYLKEFLPNQ